MESGERITLVTYARLIRANRNFRRLWFAQIVSEIGDWMYTVAIYSQLLALTGGSAQSVGFAFILQVLPQLLVSPMVGVLNDRLSRRKLMIVADLARAVIVTMMLVALSLQLIWLIYVLLFLETVFWGLFEPGRSAVIPNITEGRDQLIANSLSSTTWSFNFAVGFAIGGFIAALAGRQMVFLLNAASFLISAWFISRMRFTEPHLHDQPPLRFRDLLDFSPIAEGIRYVSGDRRLFVTMLAKCGLGFVGANWVLVTLLGERKFPLAIGGMDPQSAGMLGMSVLMGCRGLGALIGPLIGTYLAGHSQPRLRWGIAIGFAASSTGYLLLGQMNHVLLACLMLLLAHAGGAVIWVNSTTLLQMSTEDKFRGRVFSAEFAFMTVSMSTSSLVASALVDRGVAVSTVTSSVGAVMLVPGLAWLFAQRLWRRPPLSVETLPRS
ncbi:MAG TPA: MFS transporter [Bryobacteraceae bacterium]|nr:MFS transporter [Bryobacteraceae bacterium]